MVQVHRRPFLSRHLDQNSETKNSMSLFDSILHSHISMSSLFLSLSSLDFLDATPLSSSTAFTLAHTQNYSVYFDACLIQNPALSLKRSLLESEKTEKSAGLFLIMDRRWKKMALVENLTFYIHLFSSCISNNNNEDESDFILTAFTPHSKLVSQWSRLLL